MRIIPFPNQRERDLQRAWLSDLETALHGDGPNGQKWSQLREDVRALAAPMTVEFERQLSERIVEREERSAPKQPHRRLGRLRPTVPAFAAMSVACMVIAAVLIAAPWRQAGHTVERSAQPSSISARADHLGPAFGPAESARASAGVASSTPDSESPAPSSGRVQQLGASISLAPNPSEVQEVADRVSRVTASDGGFVQNSQVEVQRSGVSEASLLLRLPSAKLSGALASLGHLAPVRAESQSLQDITGAYDGARRRLADATAERTALLRALSKANTQVQITRLREQLSEVRGAISQARSSLEALSRRASTTEVAVTIYGTRHSASEGLTLHKGLRDVARVLLVVLVVLMIAAAVLVPVVALLAALITGRRWWRRYRRERVLNER